MLQQVMPWIAAVAAGVLLFLGYAGFDQYYLAWFCLVPVLWAIRDQRPGRAFQIGWVAGIVGHAGGFYWVTGMFREFAGMPWPLACLGLLFLAAANGIVFATWAWTTRLIARDSGWNLAWVSPVVWTGVEAFWPEMFPNYLGASQYRLSHLTQIADLTGILGVSFLVAYINSALYSLGASWFENRRFAWRQALILVFVVASVAAYGEFRLRSVASQVLLAEKLTLGLVQTNRGAGDKRRDPESLLREHREMSRALAVKTPLDLVVWPESVCSISSTSREGQLPADLLGDLRIPTLFGAVLHLSQEDGQKTFNSAVLADGTGRILGTYDKMVLVPFGEYIPFGNIFPRLYSLSPATGRFWAGESRQPLRFGKHLLSVNICYEDIFPGHVRSLMGGSSDRPIPEAMFNLTNDSWYGKTTEPIEHLALASFRSIEHRRSLVRATNTGISAFVDPLGQIVSRSGIWTRETLVDRIPLMKGRTVYALLGDWVGWVCAILAFAGIARAFHVGRLRNGEKRQKLEKGENISKKTNTTGKRRRH
ncbi:MAG TPA: apolipoprotein N-acyltransferase [Burkholderiales bacterium]